MVVTLAIWLYILLLAWLYGWLTLAAIGRLAGFAPRPLPSFAVVALVGLVALATLTGLLALLGPVGLTTNLALAFPAAVLAVHRRESLRAAAACELARLRGANRLVLVVFAAAALLALERTASPPTNYDTGLYHAQVIRWLETFGIVPGIANLHGRFAFSPAWFLPSALFSFPFLGLRSFHVLNGALFLLFLIYAAGGLGDWLAGRRHASAIVKVAAAAAGL